MRIERNTDYALILDQAREMAGGAPSPTAALANLSALIYNSLGGVNWAGFYLMENGRLILGPFQGKPACAVIPAGRGVCGSAALKDMTLVVPDVHRFDGHIACDSASNSEIVIPLHLGNEVAGVLDIDSPEYSRFSDDDKAGLEAVARCAEDMLAAFGRIV